MARKERKRRTFGKVRRLPSGRWQAMYPEPNNPANYIRAPYTFDTEGDADTWLTTVRSDIVRGLWKPPAPAVKPMTFLDFSAAWLAGRKVKGRPLADRTRDGYQDLLDAHILPTFGDVALSAITREMVDEWYETCSPGRPTTQARAYSLLRTILGSAVDRGLISTANPASVRGGGSVERAKDVRPASLAELEALATAMPDKHRVMVLLAAWCALRFGELAELRRSDVDTKRGVIHVRRGVVRSKTAGVKVKTPKTNAGVRDVAIPPHLVPMVRDHLKQHTAPGADGLLFPGSTAGAHLAPSSFYGRVTATTKRKGRNGKTIEHTKPGWGYYEARHVAGRDDLRFHDLRHTGAVLAAQTGATLAELMSRLGHSTPGAAMRYQHAAAERDMEIARRLSALAGE